MSIVPPTGGGSQARRPYRRPIRWDKIPPAQVNAVRTSFPRNKWRVVVNAIIENIEHYNATHDTNAVHDYMQNVRDAVGWSDDRWDQWEDEFGDDAEAIGWYHPPAAWQPGVA